MTKDEALDLALEAIESDLSLFNIPATARMLEAITAIKQALAAPMQELWEPSDTAHRPGGLPQDFIKHEVESFDDWSEWVNPNSEQYFMKCCDCGLVHEMQFKVAKYSEGDECEFVADADLQSVFRARRATPPAPVQEPYGQVTVVKRPGCVDQHWFYRWPEPPYLDNAAECHVVYTTPPAAQRQRVLFPTMLRKMWSGSEVQAWLDENVNKEKNT